MHYLLLLDLGSEVDPAAEGQVAERIGSLLAPFHQSDLGDAKRRKDYLGFDEMWAALKPAVEAGLLDRRWDPASEPAIDRTQSRAKWKADWLSAWTEQRAQSAWMAAGVRLYPPQAITTALNEVGGDVLGDYPGMYEKGYYSDDAGVYRWNIYGSWDGWSIRNDADGFPLKAEPHGANGPSRRGVARKGDIDWGRLRDEYAAAAIQRWDRWLGVSVEKRAYEAAMNDIEQTETKEAYLERHSSLLTFAFIDESQVWRERAPHLGVHATLNTTYARDFAQWLDNLPDDHALAMVDCHG